CKRHIPTSFAKPWYAYLKLNLRSAVLLMAIFAPLVLLYLAGLQWASLGWLPAIIAVFPPIVLVVAWVVMSRPLITETNQVKAASYGMVCATVLAVFLLGILPSIAF